MSHQQTDNEPYYVVVASLHVDWQLMHQLNSGRPKVRKVYLVGGEDDDNLKSKIEENDFEVEVLPADAKIPSDAYVVPCMRGLPVNYGHPTDCLHRTFD